MNILQGLQQQTNDRRHVIKSSEIPTFSGQSHEDADDFLLRYEHFATHNKLTDPEKVQHMNMALQRNALRWFECCRHVADWVTVKREFLKVFGKSFADYDIAGYTLRMTAIDQPLDHVFRSLSYLQSTRPDASEAEKLDFLFQSLHPLLKARLVTNRPSSIPLFIERIRDASRELQYQQQAFMPSQFTPTGSFPSIMTGQLVTPRPINQSSRQVNVFPTNVNAANTHSGGQITHTRLEEQQSFASQMQSVMDHPATLPTYAAYPMTGSIYAPNGQSQEKTDVDKLSDQIAKLTELVGGVMRAQFSGPRRNINRAINANGEQICFGCGRAGHIKRMCPQRSQEASNQILQINRSAAPVGVAQAVTGSLNPPLAIMANPQMARQNGGDSSQPNLN